MSMEALAQSRAARTRNILCALATCAALCAGSALWSATSRAQTAPTVVAPPATDQTGVSGPQTIVFAGGCFWGVQGVFQHVRGVESAVSGYSGGASAADAHYEIVSTGDTGFAESVKVTYDPQKIALGKLLQIFFSVALDPTEVNQQGPDVGTQYRSAIFPLNAGEASVAKDYIAQLDKSRAFSRPIATRIEPYKGFYPAEAYHQNFLTLHPDYPYIVINDLPKIENLHRLFPSYYRAKPILVALAD